LTECLGPDGVLRNIVWKKVRTAYVPAITVCLDRLYNYGRPVAVGNVTVGVVDLTIVDNAANILLSYNRTICRFSENITEATTLDADFADAEVGDELIVICNFDGGKLLFPQEKYYISYAGTQGDYFSVQLEGDWVVFFTFDGEKFISSQEYC
jgi:hypothetical protein